MNLNDWLRLLGWLAVEAAAVFAAAALLQVWIRSPREARTIWRAALAAAVLVWAAELSGLRGAMDESAPTQERFVVNAQLWAGADSARTAGAGESGLAPAPAPVKWPAWLWLAGSMALAGRSLLARGALGVRRRRAAPADEDSPRLIARLKGPLGLKRVEAQVWPNLQGPVAFGIFRPAIALPPNFAANFSESEREAMLAHEMAHLAARDPFWLMVSDAAIALAWWHPMVWLARSKLQSANEAAADEASTLTPGGAHVLAECLVRLGRELTASGPARALGIGGPGGRSHLAARIQGLLRGPRAWRPLSGRARWTPHIAAVAIALAAAALPIETGLSGSILDALASADPLPSPPASAPISKPPPAAVKEPKGRPPILLLIDVVELPDGGAGNLGLDWLFGPASTNDTPIQTSRDWTDLGTTNVAHPQNVVIDRLRIDGESVLLKPEQFAALRERVIAQGDVLSAPKIETRSGLEARVSVEEEMVCVTGVETTRSNNNINYFTDRLPTGIHVDITPNIQPNGRWQLHILADVTTFLGYDKTANDKILVRPEMGEKSPSGVIPRPRFRALETGADESLPLGQTLILRGPRWSETTETKSGLFRLKKKSVKHQRLYVFVTPQHPPA
ncbi:MAG TPA: M56 family metallopeptidase [Verrucomicrobiae bacterium]|jgi:beta-lactamase regulating signal transducer with metallopeptidase domain